GSGERQVLSVGQAHGKTLFETREKVLRTLDGVIVNICGDDLYIRRTEAEVWAVTHPQFQHPALHLCQQVVAPARKHSRPFGGAGYVTGADRIAQVNAAALAVARAFGVCVVAVCTADHWYGTPFFYKLFPGPSSKTCYNCH